MTQPRALVTGGAGFIGSHAVDKLLQYGYAVRVIDDLRGGRISNLEHVLHRPDVEFSETDICHVRPGSPDFAEVDVVLHFAGIGDIVPSIDDPETYMHNNLIGTIRTLEAARSAGVRQFIYAASSSCYGDEPPTPTTEHAPINLTYPYALSKYQGEQAAFHWAKVYDMSVNSIRIFNAYGTRSRTSGAYGAVFGVFLRQKLAAEPFTVVGDGEQRRDFVYVADVADAFVRAGLSDFSGQIWNLGSGNPQSVNRLVELLHGRTTNIPKRPGEPETTWADPTKIMHDLGWAPEITLEEGVAKMLANIDYWATAPLWNEESIAKATQNWFSFLEKSSREQE